MTRWILGCVGLLALVGCGDDGDEEDPLATAAGFCDAWGKNACNADVVKKCSEDPDAETCVESQADFCLDIVDSDAYEKTGAEECLNSVKKAFADTSITAAEAQVVLLLAAPCDRITGGGEPACKNDDGCQDEGSSCEKPEGAAVGTCVLDGGMSCEDTDLRCAKAFYCNGTHCVQRLAEGKECTGDEECQSKFKCALPAEGDITQCILRKENGEACKLHGDCQSHLCAESECASRIDLGLQVTMCEDLS